MASNFAPLHWDVLRRVHVARDAQADGLGWALAIAPCCLRGSSAGPKLKQLVE